MSPPTECPFFDFIVESTAFRIPEFYMDSLRDTVEFSFRQWRSKVRQNWTLYRRIYISWIHIYDILQINRSYVLNRTRLNFIFMNYPNLLNWKVYLHSSSFYLRYLSKRKIHGTSSPILYSPSLRLCPSSNLFALRRENIRQWYIALKQTTRRRRKWERNRGGKRKPTKFVLVLVKGKQRGRNARDQEAFLQLCQADDSHFLSRFSSRLLESFSIFSVLPASPASSASRSTCA